MTLKEFLQLAGILLVGAIVALTILWVTRKKLWLFVVITVLFAIATFALFGYYTRANAATNDFPVTLNRGGYLYYTATATLPDTHWRVHFETIIPEHRNRAYFEVGGGSNWQLEWTIDLVSSGGCSVETGVLPVTCWAGPNAIFLDTAGGKIFERIVGPIFLPLVMR